MGADAEVAQAMRLHAEQVAQRNLRAAFGAPRGDGAGGGREGGGDGIGHRPGGQVGVVAEQVVTVI